MGDLPVLPDRQLLRVPKAGSLREECEDAGHIWPGDPRVDGEGRAVTSLYAAVSDGASESLLAGAWAERLVNDVVESMCLAGDWWQDLGGFVGDLISRSADRWDAFLTWYQADRAERGRPITWYEQPGLEKGAFATVLGVELRSSVAESGEVSWDWYAFALGDSCLFHLRDGQVHGAFPINDLDDFGITPQLLGSRNHDVALVAERVRVAHGTLLPGDELLLATDALAAWLLSPRPELPAPGMLLAELAELGEESFEEWVNDQRARSRMRNDDVTLIRMRVRAEG
ncbi:hypothetical protein [Streptomyces capitiformicae]|uniref:Protein phosphatase 2C-like protein n=1 Tax=Streptomyces capitiformicae TaxID=2014920 RepID=A0A918ZG73_9ACTN|nr:hypothetical protein [Streptomyces capitiformicae]GHE49900.1 hypothetical protein GCM10017771_71470 [Streptomyces capitiformicae]